nr:uncharacterized protein LOC109187953 [Ipomoea trifida]
MAAERRDEMVRQERNEEQEGEFPLKNRGSCPDQMATDSAVILDRLMESRPEIRDLIECPICLGIINKPRIVVECMHRFCGDCIEQVLQKGMNECPICRGHIPSRTSLKDDASFDALVGAVCKVVEKQCQDKKRKAPVDERGKKTKVRRISSRSGGETSGSRAERMMECLVFPVVRDRVRGSPIEEQESLFSSVYRCIVPYLEVLYLLEEKEGDMKMEVERYMGKLNNFLHVTVEGLKEKLQKKMEQIESLIGRGVGREGANRVLESLRDAVSNVESELGKLECGEDESGEAINLKENCYATLQVIADLIMVSNNKAQPGGWKKWYSSLAEYDRDLRDAAAVYLQIGKAETKKLICKGILSCCPSFSPSQFNLVFNPSG